jgi:hypothetical protein
MDASDRYNEDLKEGKQVCADLIMRVLTEGMLYGDGKPGHPRGCTVILKVGARQQCSPRHRMTFNSRNEGLKRNTQYSPRHGMKFNSRIEGLKRDTQYSPRHRMTVNSRKSGLRNAANYAHHITGWRMTRRGCTYCTGPWVKGLQAKPELNGQEATVVEDPLRAGAYTRPLLGST